MPTLNVDGRKVTVDESFLRLSPEQQNATVEEIAASFNPPQVPSAPQPGMAEAALRGGAQGATMSSGDEMAGAAAASPIPGSQAGTKTTLGSMNIIDVLAGAGRIGLEKVAPGIFGTGGQDAYTAERDRVRGSNKAAAAANPWSYGAGQVAGSIVGGLPVGAGIGAAMMGKSLIPKMAISAVGGAGLGAVQGAGEAKDLSSVPEEAWTGARTGAVVGAVVPYVGSVLSRAVSPMRIPPERQALVDALRKEGVDLTAGQRTGSRPLQWMESHLGDYPGAGGAAANVSERQGQQFTQAALRRMGANGPLATPDVIDPAVARIGQQFEQLSARNTLNYDQRFAQDIGKTISDYDRVLPSQQKQAVAAYLQDIISQPGGMPGTMYQETRSRLARQAEALRNSDPSFSGVLKGFQKALDGAMNRSISPADQAAWQEARSQWKNWKAIERAITGAGDKTAQGYISPSQLRTAVAGQGRGQYARGQGDLAELARAGEGVMRPLPQSGTAPRMSVQNIITALGAGGGGVAGGLPGAIAGAAAPAVVGRALMSRPIQAYLGNQVAAGPASAREAIVQQLLLGAPARELLVSRQTGQ